MEKIEPACQARNSPARIADSSFRNAVSFSIARTTKRFPSSCCASTIQIVRPLESIAETQPPLKPALLRFAVIRVYDEAGKRDRNARARQSNRSTVIRRDVFVSDVFSIEGEQRAIPAVSACNTPASIEPCVFGGGHAFQPYA